MLVNIAIVEDTHEDLEELKALLNRYGKEYDVAFKIDEFSDSYSFLDLYTPTYDIIFLDIELGKENGIDTARKLRTKDSDVLIIFETNIAKFALKGYEVEALDYMLKPISYSALSMRLTKAMSIIKKNKLEGEITIKRSGGVRRVQISKILYLESKGHSIIFHMMNADFEVRDSLNNLEKILPKGEFARCNNCYLVHLPMIVGIEKDECLIGGERLQISRPKKKAFTNAFMEYLLNKGRI